LVPFGRPSRSERLKKQCVPALRQPWHGNWPEHRTFPRWQLSHAARSLGTILRFLSLSPCLIFAWNCVVLLSGQKVVVRDEQEKMPRSRVGLSQYSRTCATLEPFCPFNPIQESGISECSKEYLD
jgi:hypothetical protein